MRVLLIAPPWRIPTQGTLAIATLRPLLEQRGHEVTELHGSVFFPSVDATGSGAGSDHSRFFQGDLRYAFGRVLTGRSIDDYARAITEYLLGEMNPHSVVSAEPEAGPEVVEAALGLDRASMRARVAESIARADICLDRIIEQVAAQVSEGGLHDVVGFSATFVDQLPAAIALARRIKQRWPEIKIAFGGSACFEEQAEGLLASFPVVDAVCHVEGEDVINPMFEALIGQGRLADVPGIAWRDPDDDGRIHRNPPPVLLRDMDRLPMPDYRGFIAQFEASDWAGAGSQLYFETSRGCWWGQKKLCTFCGLNGGGLPFRAKSPERAHDEIVHLYRDYPSANVLLATDNILDVRYLDQVFPRLEELPRDPHRPLRIFYEVKSNMRPEQVEKMARGGVSAVQPGIESFSDSILSLMQKGCTALGQIQFIKWAQQAGIEPHYNLLVLNPGEQPEAYREMLELIPFLVHLPFPAAVVTMLLERFSPYHQDPERYGIENPRPSGFYPLVFGEQVDPRLAYQFDYDHAMFTDEAHLAAVREFVAVVQRWQTSWRPDTLYYMESGANAAPGGPGAELAGERADSLVIVDRRGGRRQVRKLAGKAAAIFRFLDRHRLFSAVAREFSPTPVEVLEALLDVWIHRRWVCRVGDRYLAVIPRKGPARVTGEGVGDRTVARGLERADPVRLEVLG